MDLRLPEIDNRTYEELLAEVVARIGVHNPQWTNHNDADPGITLLQLFAFMHENLLYRSRLIPERNRPDLDDVPADVREAMAFHPVMSLSEVLELALEPASSAHDVALS